MTRSPFLLLGSLVAIALLGVPATARANGGTCLFQFKGLSLNFGPLDPSSGINVPAAMSPSTANADKAGDCQPTNQTMTISADNGLNFSGSRRLKHVASADFIAYSLTGIPVTPARPGNNNYITFAFSGTIMSTAYENARAGSYSDTVIITVAP
jgi:spore coat protein U-like protein